MDELGQKKKKIVLTDIYLHFLYLVHAAKQKQIRETKEWQAWEQMNTLMHTVKNINIRLFQNKGPFPLQGE